MKNMKNFIFVLLISYLSLCNAMNNSLNHNRSFVNIKEYNVINNSINKRDAIIDIEDIEDNEITTEQEIKNLTNGIPVAALSTSIGSIGTSFGLTLKASYGHETFKPSPLVLLGIASGAITGLACSIALYTYAKQENISQKSMDAITKKTKKDLVLYSAAIVTSIGLLHLLEHKAN